MATRRDRNRRRATILGALVGGILIFTFTLSLVAPGLNSTGGDDASFPTFTPFGTPAPTAVPTDVVFPTPEPDPQLGDAPAYIHSSGYFQTFRPTGSEWTIREQSASAVEGIAPSEPTYPSVYIQGGPRLVVIHNYIRQGVEYETLEALSENLLNDEYFMGVWGGQASAGGYQSWTETARTITDDAVITAFDLTAAGMPYLGRDISRLEDSTLYVTRIVVPENNPLLLDRLVETIPQRFIGYHDLQMLPRQWPIFADPQSGYLLKYPPALQRIAGSAGLPITLRAQAEGQPETTVRLSREPGAVTSADEARAFLTALEPSAAISDVAEHTTQFGEGYALRYTFSDVSGDPQTGLAVLLNDPVPNAPQVAVARLQVNTPELDLTDAEALSSALADAQRALLAGFITLPPSAREATPDGD